jgi:hypothetical protein
MAIWTLAEPSVTQIVDVIQAASRAGLDRGGILSRLSDIGLCTEHAEDALEIVSLAFDRAQLYALGMQPMQFSGDFEDDRLFLEALNRAKGPAAPPTPRRPWWKFW